MKISELIIQTNNLTETEKFYSKTFECKSVEKTEYLISYIFGSSKLTFELTQQAVNPKYHFAFNIPINKIEEAIIWISKKTPLIKLNKKYITNFENWNAKAIYFYDNNKNILELICRNDLENYSDTEFSKRSIENINEVGVVTDKPIELGDRIIEKTDIDFFVKGPKREDFATLGNEDGLFVISNPNRNWYPTKNKAEKQKIKVKIKVEANNFELEFN